MNGPVVCWLTKHPEYGGCCCQCKNHLRDLTQSLPGKPEYEWWIAHTGWICTGFASEGTALSNQPEHGMCELFTPAAPVLVTIPQVLET